MKGVVVAAVGIVALLVGAGAGYLFGHATGGAVTWLPNLILFGATISSIGAVILLYGVATKGKQ